MEKGWRFPGNFFAAGRGDTGGLRPRFYHVKYDETGVIQYGYTSLEVGYLPGCKKG